MKRRYEGILQLYAEALAHFEHKRLTILNGGDEVEDLDLMLIDLSRRDLVRSRRPRALQPLRSLPRPRSRRRRSSEKVEQIEGRCTSEGQSPEASQSPSHPIEAEGQTTLNTPSAT
jgi:hypothetical protein